MTQNQSVDQRIAGELGVAVRQVNAAVELLDGGATVPFIARYRKEATGALDDAQLRTLEERLRYLRELDERRDAILIQIAAQGKLTDELEAQIRAADSKARLEDLYLPYRPKRRTKAQIAREAGLEPLDDVLLHDPSNDPQRAEEILRSAGVKYVILWDSLRGETLGALNALLKEGGLPTIVVKQPKEKIEREGPDDFEP